MGSARGSTLLSFTALTCCAVSIVLVVQNRNALSEQAAHLSDEIAKLQHSVESHEQQLAVLHRTGLADVAQTRDHLIRHERRLDALESRGFGPPSTNPAAERTDRFDAEPGLIRLEELPAEVRPNFLSSDILHVGLDGVIYRMRLRDHDGNQLQLSDEDLELGGQILAGHEYVQREQEAWLELAEFEGRYETFTPGEPGFQEFMKNLGPRQCSIQYLPDATRVFDLTEFHTREDIAAQEQLVRDSLDALGASSHSVSSIRVGP